MTDERRFEEMLAEFERVGVDLDSFPAGLTIRREDAMRILRELPNGAGPAAFLARVRQELHATASRAGGDEMSATG
ncbi:MAG TPA: hypothetical protein VGP25_20770 [Gemmatimonadaceae bacterium]|jgi:hypothetical protein|nr:hypothetical protein [Gemmatimonadaceae bacterium]